MVRYRDAGRARNAMDTPRAIISHLLARPASLAELGAATGVSLPTLRRAVADLQRARWVRIVGRAEPTGGRPANLFGIDAVRHAVVGVHLEHPGMRLVATDLVGEPLDELVPEGLADLEPDAVHTHVLAYLERVRTIFPGRRLLGVGLASPGFIDAATGTVVAISRVPSWHHLPLPQRLSEASGLSVTIGNDVDALAALEFGANGDARSYAYLGLVEGVKFSLFLDGRPYVGPFGNAGLVDLRLLAAGAADDARGLLTVHGLPQRYLARAGASADPRVLAAAEGHERFLAVLQAGEAGDAHAAELAAVMTGVLAAQVASLVLLLQPELLVLGGALAGAPERVLADLEGAARRQLPTLLDNALRVRRARTVSPSAAALGAARVFVRRFLAGDGTSLSVLGDPRA